MRSPSWNLPAGVAAVLTTAALLALPAEAGAAPGLTAAERMRLLGLGMPVLVPGQLPDGFRPVRVTATACPAGAPRVGPCREGPSYSVLYRDGGSSCLLVWGVGGGVGGGAAAFEYTIQSPLLGEVVILFGEPSRELSGPPGNQPPQPSQLDRPQSGLSSFPATLRGQPRSPYFSLQALDSDRDGEDPGCGSNRRISPRMLEGLLQSLQRLQ